MQRLTGYQLETILHKLFIPGKSGPFKGTTFTRYKQFVQNCFKLIPRQALHAKSLGFMHPSEKKLIYFDSEYPDDLAMVIEKWRHYSAARTVNSENEK